jgi:hypothetical protein
MMKLQDVLLKAMAKKITWMAAAEIVGVTDRTMRRIKQRYEELGYDGLFDQRRGKRSIHRIPMETAERMLQRVDQLLDISKYATADSVLGQVAEEVFDHLEPGGARGREVDMETRMPRQPAFYLRMFVGGIVICDDVKFFLRRRRLIEQPQEAQPFRMTVPLLAQADHLPGERVQGRESVVVPFRL